MRVGMINTTVNIGSKLRLVNGKPFKWHTHAFTVIEVQLGVPIGEDYLAITDHKILEEDPREHYIRFKLRNKLKEFWTNWEVNSYIRRAV